MGYAGGYTRLTDFLREVRPPRRPVFERRFETPPGRQGQVDFAEFKVEFADAPGVVRKVWLFTMVLGHSRWLWGRFCASQDLQTVLRCHIEAFAAMAGAPRELLYDRMKTAVIGEDAEGVVNYNVSLVSSDTHLYELRRHPVLRGVAQRSGPGGRADRQESERAPRGRGPPGSDGMGHPLRASSRSRSR